MTLIKPSLDYSSRDFDALKARLQGLIRSVFPDWTDLSVATFGNILLELFAYTGDTLHFYQDNQAGEAFWPTLRQRISAIRHGALINFKLRTAAAAMGTVQFSIGAATTLPVVIPLGMRLSTTDTNNPIYYRTTAAATIPIGQTYADVPVEQAQTRLEEFISTEEPSQEFILQYTPFLDDSITNCVWAGPTLIQGIHADNGDYTAVDSFLSVSATDRCFMLVVDQYDRAHLRFGNGTTGAVPTGTIKAAYKIGGGAEGNVEANQIQVLLQPILYTNNTPASVAITNAAAMTGGADRMTITEARVQAPATLRIQNRCVTRQDFEDAAISVRAVARALMATAIEYGGIEENTGNLYVVAQGSKLSSGRILPATPSQAILDAVSLEIQNNKPATITFTYSVSPVIFKTVTIYTQVNLRQGYDEITVGSNIRLAVEEFFAAQLEDGTPNPTIDFGANLRDAEGTIVGEISWSDVFNAIRDIEGVRKIDEGAQGLLINGRHASLELAAIEFPKLLSVTIVNLDTGHTI